VRALLLLMLVAGVVQRMGAQAPPDAHRRIYAWPRFGRAFSICQARRICTFRLPTRKYESAFFKNVSLRPIPSLWGHLAGAGSNAADSAFLNDQIRRFLER
jgi:hypothetical protein